MVPVTHEGLFFKFPFAVEKTTYPWWDGDLAQAADISFVKEENLYGTNTYVFQQDHPTDRGGDSRCPRRSSCGSTGDTPAKVMYGNTRTLWIEPNTGVIIKGQEQSSTILRDQDLGTVATTKGTIGYTEETVRDNAETWGSKGRLLGFIGGPFMGRDHRRALLIIAVGLLLIVRLRPPVHRPPRSSDGVQGIAGLGVGGVSASAPAPESEARRGVRWPRPGAPLSRSGGLTQTKIAVPGNEPPAQWGPPPHGSSCPSGHSGSTRSTRPQAGGGDLAHPVTEGAVVLDVGGEPRPRPARHRASGRSTSAGRSTRPGPGSSGKAHRNGWVVEKTKRPPGRSTRAASAMTTSESATNGTTP